MPEKKLPKGLVRLEDDQPKIVSPDDPLVITSTTASFPWIQIQPGGEIRVQTNSTVEITKLEKVAAGSRRTR